MENHYLLGLRCLGHSFIIDGKPWGLSARCFSTAAACEGFASVNTSWLGGGGDTADEEGALDHPFHADPLEQVAALGNLFNHSSGCASLLFDICPLPASLPPPLLKFVPSLNAGSFDPSTRWVPLVVARRSMDASQGPTELFVDYGTNPCSLGYHP